MRRRTFLSVSAATAVTAASGVASGGSYLNRAALLLDAAKDEREMVLPRSQDEELLRVVHAVAEARARVARSMHVPDVVAGAHPHLLLVMESCERAYAAAIDGDHQKFVERVFRARREDRIFRKLIEELGYTLPNID